MENLMIYGLFLIGLIMIIKGGDLFVDAAVEIAMATGIPPILIGATLVSLATTLPEFFVSTIATLKGHPEMAVGNAIGSTICNIGFILGICACISPISIRRRFFSIKGFLMIVSLGCFYFFAIDKVVLKTEGFMLLLLLILYIIINILEVNYKGSKTSKDLRKHIHKKNIFFNGIKFILGGFLVVLGARLLVDNGVEMAKIFHIPEQIISLTLIALGTSLPELVTSVTATLKGHEGISVGNIVGANVLNITMVLGTSCMIPKNGLYLSTRDITFLNQSLLHVPQTLVFDIPFALLLMSILVLCGTMKKQIDRKHGMLLFTIYVVYIGLLGAISF
ncbi:calcium/sodium antiporter [Inediibacterium massiliense]|uniref:calcium/sodium antiporter n=1 Tax=Inediibacterium massiliense TaxID=1658111 RepID=UPI0006B5295C|nr:calcium/sodium antiporter [Inediibacterium massiliense]